MPRPQVGSGRPQACLFRRLQQGLQRRNQLLRGKSRVAPCIAETRTTMGSSSLCASRDSLGAARSGAADTRPSSALARRVGNACGSLINFSSCGAAAGPSAFQREGEIGVSMRR